ncbi:type III-A CRISPR-associated RAMP protein Csm5 [Candidatus Micrarchaeota archaeon]|nr:type III-A CRISPR-associated RAMP protein Csm5 [Candidatus Micrarchaeota archaeon]
MTQFYLKTLAPVHIGCDEAYEPLEFVVDENAHEIIRFDPEDFYGSMTDDDLEGFTKICRQGDPASILGIYKFLRGRSADGRRVKACKGFIDQYQKTLSMSVNISQDIINAINDFVIERTSFLSDTGRPYIPGSSIKGAIRTAYLNLLAHRRNVSRKTGKYANTNLEKELLDDGKFDTDPFSMLKVSDFRPVGEVNTKIIYSVNEKKNPQKYRSRQLHQILEVVLPGAIFMGTISVNQPHPKSGIKTPLDMQTLKAALNAFYKSEKEREDQDLENIGAKPPINMDLGNANLMRIGRHSGAESITIEAHRNIKISPGSPRDAKYGTCPTTISLASETKAPKHKENLVPFGWALLGEVDAERLKDLDTLEKDWNNVYFKDLRKSLEMKKQRQRRLEEKRLKEREALEARKREEERRQVEEEERKARLEAMSPEERDIWAIRHGELKEHEVVEIYNRLDDFQDKIALAQALKEYWMGQKKWKKKECSKKQAIKVQRIKDILGE